MNYHHGNLRRELLDRAAQIIAEHGVEALSLRALAQDLGVSHNAPTRHFRDKLDLLRALATEGYFKLADYVSEAADAAGTDPLERYAALGRAYVRFSLEYPAYYKAGRHPEVAAQADEELKEAHRQRTAILVDAARQAQAAGWLPDESVEDAVTFSLATVRGLAALLSDPLFTRSMGKLKREALIDRMVRQIIDPEKLRATKSKPPRKQRT